MVEITVMINIIKATTFIIATIIILITINYRKKSVIFMAKKIIYLIDGYKMINKKQKNLKRKTENFRQIKANTIYF